jgi:hypothetical protein
MAAYSTGSAKITAGSAKVYGVSTEWDTYLAAGDLFKINGDSVFYEVSVVNNATQLTLTSRYDDSNLHSAVATNIASVTTATQIYSGTFSFSPVIQNSLVIEASPGGGGERFTDNGAGALVGGATPGGSGTVDYDSGAWSVTFGTPLTATLNLTASYNRGIINQGLSYQAIVDFTPNFTFPEMSTNDVNFAHIYTKAVRLIDAEIKVGTRAVSNIVNASITNASIQKAKILNASITNASIQKLKVTNASITTASIQKAKILNASITTASIQKLKVSGYFAKVVFTATNYSATICKSGIHRNKLFSYN